MSSNEELWEQLAQRVTLSQVAGVSAEDDDVLAHADIVEALINPHKGTQSAAPGMGAPGMMPPMMMGGMGGGAGGGAAGSARVTEAAPGPMAAPSRTAAAAGIPGEARMEPHQPSSPAGAGLGSGGGGFGGGEPTVGSDTPIPPPAKEPRPEPAVEVASAPMQTAEPPERDAPPPPEKVDGFAVDPGQLRTLGEKWTEMAAALGVLADHPESTMGLFEDAQRPHQALSQQLNSWRQGAVGAFEAVVQRLHATAAQYASADDEGVQAIRHTEGLNP